jgi:hypothetical protein
VNEFDHGAATSGHDAVARPADAAGSALEGSVLHEKLTCANAGSDAVTDACSAGCE